MKEKQLPNKKQKSISQKWLIVLILAGVVLVVAALGVTVISKPKPQKNIPKQNKIAAKKIAVPTPEQKHKIPVAAENKTEKALPVKSVDTAPTPAPSDLINSDQNKSPQAQSDQAKSGQTQSEMKAKFIAMADHLDDSQMQAKDGEAEAQDLTTQQQPTETPTPQDQPVQVSMVKDPKAKKPEIQDQIVQKTVQEMAPSSSHNLKPSPAEITPTDHRNAPFAIQVGVFRYEVYADRKLNVMKRLGYPAFIHEVIGRAKEPIYLVCFGRYVTRAEAVPIMREFKEKEKMDAVVAFLKPR